MRNLSSLIIVLCLLVVLGCKCQSNMFGLGEKTPVPTVTPTPAPTSSPTATPDNMNRRRDDSTSDNSTSENSLLKTGSYTGRAKNLTYNQNGDLLLRIDSVDADGNVKAYMEASNGLQGKADMEGTIKSNGKLELSGTLDDDQSVAISATVKGDTISGGYGLADSNLKTQSGNFTVRRR